MQAYTPMTLEYDPAGHIEQNADDVVPVVGELRKKVSASFQTTV